jgi:Mrp family chromosome partitioning ATPase
VVLDSHPVLAATDSLLLGQHADAVILSLMREVSERRGCLSGVSETARTGIRLLGAVVNGCPRDVHVAGSRRAARAVA